MVRWAGVEPATKGLKGPCSTTELPAHSFSVQEYSVIVRENQPRVCVFGREVEKLGNSEVFEISPTYFYDSLPLLFFHNLIAFFLAVYLIYMEERIWHATEIDEVVRILAGNREGLTSDEVRERLEKYGNNQLPEPKHVSPWKIFSRQFISPLAAFLGIAGVISFLLGDIVDVIGVFAVLFINVFLGFFQEYRADRRMRVLRAMVEVLVTVRRNGIVVQVPAEDLVPGDVMFLRAGMRIGADARLLAVNDMATHEAALTGESREIEKGIGSIPSNARIFERSNMVFMGTSVARGTARAMVVETGARTLFAGIAREAQETQGVESGLRKELQGTAKMISLGVLALSTILFFLGLVRGESPLYMLHVSIALAVAAVPEGLLIATTVALAVALQRMAKACVLVRELSVPERLSAVDVVCVDKTGTLTTGNMEVELCDTARPELMRMALSGLTAQSRTHASLALSLTEQALANFVMKEGVEDVAVVESVPFSSLKKYSEVTLQTEQGLSVFRLGAPEVLFSSLGEESSVTFSLHDRAKALATRGLRVLMLVERSEHSSQSRFLAFFGIADPLRKDAQEMVSRLCAQGVRLIMLTGDHQETAQVIATRLGIEGRCIRGDELQGLSDAQLARLLRGVSVIARMVPQDKLRIVRALQVDGRVVAMTGDGVNDSPALAAADVGIALQSGSDVAREVADVVLVDDRLATISYALQEGRGTFLGLQRIVSYLIMLSLSVMVVFACALFSGSYLPLSSVQVLWLNVVVDGIPAFGLATFISYDLSEVARPRAKHIGIFSQQLRMFLGLGISIFIIPLCILFFTTNTLNNSVRSGMFFVAFVLDAVFALWLFAHVRRFKVVLFLCVISSVAFTASLLPFFVFSSEMILPSYTMFFGLCVLSFAKCGVLWLVWRVILGRIPQRPEALVS